MMENGNKLFEWLAQMPYGEREKMLFICDRFDLDDFDESLKEVLDDNINNECGKLSQLGYDESGGAWDAFTYAKKREIIEDAVDTELEYNEFWSHVRENIRNEITKTIDKMVEAKKKNKQTKED